MKAGEYVRYKTLSNQIKINKIKNIVEPDDSELSMTNIILYDLDNKDVTADKYIIKSSPNIIDLIEVGDIIKGIGNMIFSVIDIDYNDKIISGVDFWCEEKDIKSIVTKEQFESMEYKVKE